MRAEEQRREAVLVTATARMLLMIMLPTTIVMGLGRLVPHPELAVGMLSAFMGLLVVSQLLVRRGWIVLAGHLVVLGLLFMALGAVIVYGGVQGPNVSGLPMVVLFAGVLLGWRVAVGYGLASAVAVCALAFGTVRGIVPAPPFEPSIAGAALMVVVSVTMTALFLSISLKQRRDAQQAAERAARTARANHERLEQLVVESPDGLAWFDARGRVMNANPAFFRLCAAPGKRVIGRAVPQLDHFSEASRSDAVRAMERLANGEIEQRFVLRTDDGTTCIAEVNATRVFLPDSTEAFQWIARDVTERELATASRDRLLAELREARRLEGIGRLAGGVAHDFNNLLTAVNANAELLARDRSLPERVRRQLEVIHQAGERAAGLTQQLLAFARRQVLEPQPIELRRAIGEMKTLLEGMLGEGVRLELALGSQDTWVEADRSRLEQVVTNLSLNASEAMPGGGRLEISLLRRIIGSAHTEMAPGAYAVLLVRDSGCGMDPATAERIFEPFFTTKSEAKGTGLGLATVHGIVKQSGGHVSVASSLGQGSTFEVCLPQIEAPASRQRMTPDRSTPAPGEGGVVLVVDDEQLVRETVQSVLELSGFEVITADGPESASQVMESRRGELDLLVTDVVMPRESGPDLAARLRLRWPGLRVIFMSGYADDLNTGRWKVVPPSHYLQKPFTPSDLRELVSEVMSEPPHARAEAQ